MKKKISFTQLILVLTVFSGVIVFGNHTIAIPVIDQEQAVIDFSVGGLAIGGQSNQVLAQVVTAGITGVLTEVRFPLGLTYGTLLVEIQGVLGDMPHGITLTSQMFSTKSLIQPQDFKSLVLSKPVFFSAGDRFAIVLSSDGDGGVYRGPIGDPYPGGDSFYWAYDISPPTWILNGIWDGRLDLPFQTVVEPLKDLVAEYYLDVLGRSPEPGGAEWWVAETGRIVSLGIDVKEGFQGLAKFFFDSEEYGLKGKNSSEFVTDLYQTFLNRTPDVDGLNFWADYLGQGLTRDMLITQFAYSEEFKLYMANLFGSGMTRPENNLVNDLYRGFLNRFPDTGGFNGWLGMMRTAQCTGEQAVRDLTYQISSAFVNSAEYGLRNRNNQEFVEDLYNGILRRGADPDGFINWVNVLNTQTRDLVLKSFTDSAEFQLRVQEVINAGCTQ